MKPGLVASIITSMALVGCSCMPLMLYRISLRRLRALKGAGERSGHQIVFALQFPRDLVVHVFPWVTPCQFEG